VKSEEVLYGYQRKTEGVYIAHETSQRHSNVIILITAHPLKCVILRTTHGAPIVNTVQQPLHLPRMKYNET
jgi:hypothetical protein